ncbi:MAG TPA: hypothetical protein VLL97_05215, partial [Acidobacteriota bacterium]|nr:hypothetical protein [Acidobacteriota bacterium]
YAAWPAFNHEHVEESVIELPVQINGKVRSRITASAGATQEALRKAALNDPRVAKYLEGNTVRTIIVIPGKLVNIVAAPGAS